MIAPHAMRLLKRYEKALADQHGVTLEAGMPMYWQDQLAAGVRDVYTRAGVNIDDPAQANAAFIGALDVFDTVMSAGMQAPGAVLYELRVLHFLADCAEGKRAELAGVGLPEVKSPKSFWRKVFGDGD